MFDTSNFQKKIVFKKKGWIIEWALPGFQPLNFVYFIFIFYKYFVFCNVF